MHPSQQHQPPRQPWQETGNSRDARHPYLQPGPPPPRKNRGVRVALALGGVLVAMIVLVIAVAPDRPAARSERAKAAASSSASSAAETVPVSEVPRPTAKQARLLRSELGLIDPGLDHERSIGRARNSCWDLLNGMDRSKVADRTQQRFDGGSASVDIIDAGQILGVIEATFCHG